MRKLLIALCACVALIPTVASARNYVFDCGGQQIPGVILSGRYVRVGVYRVNSIATFEVSIGGIDATVDVIRTQVFRWDQLKDVAFLDGRHCRLLTTEEVDNLADPQFGNSKDGDK
jgi:hypothetical protein